MAEMIWCTFEAWPWASDGGETEMRVAEALGVTVTEIPRPAEPEHYARGFEGEAIVSYDEKRSCMVFAWEGELNYGILDDDGGMRSALQGDRMAYWFTSDSKYEYDGTEEWWHPGMQSPRERAHLNSGGAAIDWSDYAAMRQAASDDGTGDDGTVDYLKLGRLIADYMEADPTGWKSAEVSAHAE